MPVYNVENYLDRCIQSIIDNQFIDYELIIVDDGSTDNSGLICDFYAKKDRRIKVIHKENGGLVSAREIALAEATGDFITFVDSDDYIESNAYGDIISFMKEENLDICIAGHKNETEDGSIRIPYLNLCQQIMSREKAIINMFHEKYYGWCLWDKIYRKEIIKDIVIDKEIACGEDLIRNWYAFNKAKRIGFYPINAYHYILRNASMTRNGFSAKTDTILDVFNEIQTSNITCSDNVKKAISIGWLNRYLGVYALLLIYGGYKYRKVLVDRRKVIKSNLKSIITSDYISKIKKLISVIFCLPLFVQFWLVPLLRQGYERK